MKLLTHNMLVSNVKNITNRFPLGIRSTQVEEEENDYNEDFTKRMIPRLEYAALRQASIQVRPSAHSLCVALVIDVALSIRWASIASRSNLQQTP